MRKRLSALVVTVGWRLALLATKLAGTNYAVSPDTEEVEVGAIPRAPSGRKLMLRWRSKDAPKPQTITLLFTLDQSEMLMVALANAINAVRDAEDPAA